MDTDRFARAVRRGRDLLRQDRADEASAVLGPALAAWAEPLPEDRYEDWSEPTRRDLTVLRRDGLEAAAEAALRRDDPAAAGAFARAATDLDATREAPVILLARSLAMGGDRAGALAVLDDHRRILGSQLGIDPSPEAVAVRGAVLRGDPDHAIGTGGQDAAGVPHPTTELVGRRGDLAELERLLQTARLVTITGPGGVGKTRLAVELAHRSRHRPAYLCALEHIDRQVVAHAVAHAVDAVDAPGAAMTERLVAALRDRRALLVLDGCDAVIQPVASLVDTLLAGCPRLTVLVTSRERTGLASEHLRHLPPLSLVDDTLALAATVPCYAQYRLAPELNDWALEAAALDGCDQRPGAAAALGAAALGLTNRGELREADRLARRALAATGAASATGAAGDRTWALKALSMAALYRGDREGCHRFGAQLEAEAEPTGDLFAVVDARLIRAAVEVFSGGDDGLERARSALADAERLGNPSLLAVACETVGEALQERAPEEALAMFDRALETSALVSCRLVRGLALLAASSTLTRLGRVPHAAESCRLAILHWRRAGYTSQQWTTLRNAAELLAAAGQHREADLILRAATTDGAPEPYGRQAERLAELRSALRRELADSSVPETRPDLETAVTTALAALAPRAGGATVVP